MRATWILLLSFFSVVAAENQALSWCTSCTAQILEKCTGKDELEKCEFGVVKEICECCDVCAKGPDETCGGPWYMDGKCGEGLQCHPDEDSEHWYYPGNCSAEPLQSAADEIIKKWETFY